jgi:hypothetical protein
MTDKTEAAKNPYLRTDYPTHLDIDWLVLSNLPIYVRNTTRPRGQVAINFTDVSGKAKTRKIPRTHLPYKLTGQLSSETIQRSDDLRQTISKGVLELVRPDIAWQEMQDPDNAYEIERLQLSDFAARNAFVSPRVKDMENIEANKGNTTTPETLGIETNVINPRILGIVEKVLHGDMPIKAALSELRVMETELKDTDCSYIITNGPEGQIRGYAQKVLAKIRGQGTQPQPVAQDDDNAEPTLTPEEMEREQRREAAARALQHV